VRRFSCDDPEARATFVELAAAAARRGELVVFPTDTVYAVACDAFFPGATDRLNDAKERTTATALPVMVGSVRGFDALAVQVTPEEKGLVQGYWPGPLTVVCKAQPTLQWDLGGPGSSVALRMPLHPVALAVLQAVGPMAVVTANRAGGPVPLDCDAAVEQLGDAVSVYLDAGPCVAGPPSTIVDLREVTPRLLREGAVPAAELASMLPDLVIPDASATDP
jgi:tRNA threonylcarbamoyl adenosine modification protein (Sua5/YciO/YrdC/YwlC family)